VTLSPVILVVEDEEMIRMMAADMLEALGAGVIEAATAAEAMDAARSESRFDAAMIDLSLPDGLGDELTLKLRALRPALPVIIATGHDHGMISEEVRGLDGLVLLPKPYELGELDAALNRALGR
jgi:DNA-binding response OmpR family regulator